jgi:ribosomal protein S20
MAVEITKDNVSRVFKSMAALTKNAVYVGIPESNAPRPEESDINNAALGYIHEFGAPKANIPARPFLVPAVKNIERQAIEELKKASQDALAGNADAMIQKLNRVGIIAMNEAKRMINSNIPPPLKPKTIKNRYRSRGTKTRRPNEELYLSLIAQGVEPGVAQDQAGIIALINTGELRNSITYVVKK